jgi:hypothetical protein
MSQVEMPVADLPASKADAHKPINPYRFARDVAKIGRFYTVDPDYIPFDPVKYRCSLCVSANASKGTVYETGVGTLHGLCMHMYIHHRDSYENMTIKCPCGVSDILPVMIAHRCDSIPVRCGLCLKDFQASEDPFEHIQVSHKNVATRWAVSTVLHPVLDIKKKTVIVPKRPARRDKKPYVRIIPRPNLPCTRTSSDTTSKYPSPAAKDSEIMSLIDSLDVYVPAPISNPTGQLIEMSADDITEFFNVTVPIAPINESHSEFVSPLHFDVDDTTVDVPSISKYLSVKLHAQSDSTKPPRPVEEAMANAGLQAHEVEDEDLIVLDPDQPVLPQIPAVEPVPIPNAAPLGTIDHESYALPSIAGTPGWHPMFMNLLPHRDFVWDHPPPHVHTAEPGGPATMYDLLAGSCMWPEMLVSIIYFSIIDVVPMNNVAQVHSTMFAHMQVAQLEILARDASQRRKIFRVLLGEEEYWKPNSRTRSLMSVLHIDCIPIFTKSQHTVVMTIPVDGGTVDVRCNPSDCRGKWFKHAVSKSVLRSQAWFDFSSSVSMTHKVDDQVLATLTDFLNKCTATVSKMVEVSLVQKFTSCCLKLIAAYMAKFEWKVCSVLLMDLLLSYGVSDAILAVCLSIIKGTWSSFSALFVSQSTLTAQSGTSVVSVITSVVVLLSTCLFGKFPSGVTLQGIVAGIKTTGDISRGLKNSWTFLYDVVLAALDKLSSWFYGVPADITEVSKYSSKVVDWYKRVLELTKIDTNEDLKKDVNLCNKIVSIYKEGLEISVGLRHSALPRGVLDGFHVHFAQVKDLYRRASTSGAFSTGARVEPVMIYLCGSSGIGKSVLTPMIASMMCMIDGVNLDENGKPDVFREIYNRSTVQEFWDGYYGQRVVVYDDFAQRVDSTANPNTEFDEIIRTGNLTRYPLHMADLTDKDNTNFVSRVVIMTSNQMPAEMIVRSLNTPQAVKRRLEHSYRMVIDPEVSTDVEFEGRVTQRLDPAKVRAIYNKPVVTDFYRFHKVNPETNVVDPDYIRLPALLNRLREAYLAKAAAHVEVKDWILDACAVGFDNTAFDPRTPPPPPPTGRVVEEPADEFSDALEALTTNGELPSFLTAQLASDVVDKRRIEEYVSNILPGAWVDTNIDMYLTNEAKVAFQDVVNAEDDTDQFEAMFVWQTMPNKIIPSMVAQLVDDPIIRPNLIAWDAVTTSKSSSWFKQIKLTIAQVGVTIKTLAVKIKEHVSEHWPWYMAFLAIAPICLIYRAFAAPPKEQLMLVNVRHVGVFAQDGVHPAHCHKCDSCGTIGSHSHPPLSPIDEIRTVHLCARCQSASLKFVMDENEKAVIIHVDDRKSKVDKAELVSEYLKDLDPNVPSPVIQELLDQTPEFKGRSVMSLKMQGHTVVSLSNRSGVLVAHKAILDAYDGPTSQAYDKATGERIVKRNRSRRVQEFECDVEGDLKDPTAQIADDNCSLDIGVKILKNTYLISVITPSLGKHTVRGVFLKDRVMLTVLHLRRHLVAGNMLHVRNVRVKDGWTIPCSSLKLREVVGPNDEFLDQLLIEFPKSVTPHPDITGFIADSTTMSMFDRINAGLCVAVDNATALIRTGEVASKHDVTYSADGDVGEVSLVLRRSYEYSGLQNNNGDCGSPLVAMNSKVQKKFMGIHVCGAYGVGYSTALNSEYITKAISALTLNAQLSFCPEESIEYEEKLEHALLPPGNFMLLGEVKQYVSSPCFTKLRKSPVHGVLAPSTMAPARLAPFLAPDGELKNPMSMSLAKAGKTPPHLDEKILDVATAAVKTVVNSFQSEEYRRVLTEAEAIEGVGEHFVALNRRTSAGYPWVLQAKGSRGKTRWLGETEYKYDAELKQAVDKRLAAAKQGKRLATVWVDTLKDEKRPIPKVVEGKTRTISAGPVDYLLLFRRYFGGFAAHAMKHRIHNEISVGIDMFCPAEVKRLVDHITSKGDGIVAGDFSNFDGTLCPQVLYKVLEIIEDFYQGSEEDQLVRRVLFEDITNSLHMRGSCLYMWTHSQPSGNPLTSFINSLFNSISIRYVWMMIAPSGFRNMVSFRNNVAMQSYGDDNLIGVSRLVANWFNQITITEGYKHLNMVYTMEDKTGEIIPLRNISQVSYLKRSFRLTADGYWVAPLDRCVIMEMPQWVHGDIDQAELCVTTMATALVELALHGEEIYREVSPSFSAAARVANLPLLVMSYDEMVDLWMARVGLTQDLVIGADDNCRVSSAAKPDPKPGAILSGWPFEA